MIISWWLAILIMSTDHLVIEIKGDYKTKEECRDASKELKTTKETFCISIAHEWV